MVQLILKATLNPHLHYILIKKKLIINFGFFSSLLNQKHRKKNDVGNEGLHKSQQQWRQL